MGVKETCFLQSVMAENVFRLPGVGVLSCHMPKSSMKSTMKSQGVF